MRYLPLALLMIAPLASPALAEEWTGKVVMVTKGDAIIVQRHESPVRLRLLGVDCPEREQPFGHRARQFTADLLLGREVLVRGMTLDPEGRAAAWIFFQPAPAPGRTGLRTATAVLSRCLNEELLRTGLAWHDRRDDPRLARLEAEARAARRGLWADAAPTPPWRWRQHHPAASTPTARPSGAADAGLPAKRSGGGGATFGQTTAADLACRRDRDCVIIASACDCSAMGYQIAVRLDRARRLIRRWVTPQVGKACLAAISAHPSCLAKGVRCQDRRCTLRFDGAYRRTDFFGR